MNANERVLNATGLNDLEETDLAEIFKELRVKTKGRILRVGVIGVWAPPPECGQTVQSLIQQHQCSLAPMEGLTLQLAKAVQCLSPGLLGDLRNVKGVSLKGDAAATPFLQTAAIGGLQCAMRRQNDPVITLNSAFRTVNQQVVLYNWQHSCGVYIAAKPGSSNHESGLAIDVAAYDYWKSSLTNCGFTKLGANDPVHYDYTAGGTDLRRNSVMAFQKIWNVNNPGDRIGEDGIYGPATEARLLKSPLRGFAKNIC